MELYEFLTKNGINLPDPILSLCEEGIGVMRNSVDPVHDENHIFRILYDLDRFFKEEAQIDKSGIDLEVLLLSICWHDVWKSRRFPTNPALLLLDQILEGRGSARMFTRRAKEVLLETNLVYPVSYSIRKHSRFQILPIKTPEAKILKDLDNLEEWSLERLKLLKKKFLISGQINPRLLRLAKFWFDHFMTKTTDSGFHFQWSKTEFAKRKKLYLGEVNKLLIKYGNNL